MQKLHFSVEIDAPAIKVWNTLIADKTYREWTKPFNPASYYVGSWEEGAEIRFIGLDQNGNEGGIIARISESRKYEYISIEHFGIIESGADSPEGEKIKPIPSAYENYTFVERDGRTELKIEMEAEESWKDMFEEIWPKALGVLKELCEKQ